MNSLFIPILAERAVVSRSGERFPYHSGISAGVCEALAQEVGGMLQPRVLEIGMAYGTSSVHLGDGIEQAGGGRLVSIDPHQNTHWHGIGVQLLEQMGHAKFFRLIEVASSQALPELVGKGDSFDFVFIDGWHSFDHVFVDFFYSDQLLQPGGLMAFHDCGMPSVSKVLRFIEAHKSYRLHRRLAYGFNTRGWVKWWMLRQADRVRRVARFLSRADAVFEPAPYKEECRIYRKTSDSQVPWDYHRCF